MDHPPDIEIQCKKLSKTYVMGEVMVPVLRDIDLDIYRGELTAVLGASGAGKTTLLNIIGGIGRPVEILDGVIGPTPVSGRVEKIKPEALTKISSLGVEQQRVPVIISFVPEDREKLEAKAMGLGYRVRVKIYTSEAENALVIPRLSLFRDFAGGWQVFAAESGRACWRTVEVGLTNDSHAQILEGLSENEEVIVSPPNALRDGMRIRPQT